jgi:secreted PhoX family phosphatase
VGTKSRTGNDIERAGLVNGTVYRVAVNGTNAAETRAADAGLGLVANPTSGRLEAGFILVPGADIANAASTKFLRPEDGAWDKKNKNRFYFVTTDQPDAAKDGNANTDIPAGQIGRSRVWALNFTDSAQPELGGKIELLLDGTLNNGEYQMLDNMTVNDDGTLILQEDVGNNKHNGKMWKFNPATGDLVKISRFDQALFGDIGIASTITKDEETSGVIDVTKLLGRNDGRVYNLFVVQNHAPSGDAETVEGGQLVLMSTPAAKHKDDDDNEGGRRD